MADEGRLSIYISSTYSDLAEYRRATHDALRKMGHDVRAMEEYIAADERPVDHCLRDVRSCDLYVGIFAWRYGYVPPAKDNPEGKSITQLEFEAARESQVPCLIFMLAAESPWPPSLLDAQTGESDAGKKIDALRRTLSESYMASFFTSPAQLASQVGIAVAMHAQQRLAMRSATASPEVALPAELADTDRLQFGGTLLPDLAERIGALLVNAESAQVGEVNLGEGDLWWSTRLFLLAALVEDFTEIEQLLILGKDQEFMGLTTPRALRRELARLHPTMADAYQLALSSVPEATAHPEIVNTIVFELGNELSRLGETEEGIQEPVTPSKIQAWLGGELVRDAVARDGQRLGPILYRQILMRRPFLVPVTDNYRLEAIVDRRRLAHDIALDVLEKMI